jgi:hypothetical protein
MGLDVKPPEATFYLWVDCTLHVGYLIIIVSKLPDEIHTGLAFFEACLEEKVIVVPGMLSLLPHSSFQLICLGLFFDINPKNRRDLSHSPCHHFIRYFLQSSVLIVVFLLGRLWPN